MRSTRLRWWSSCMCHTVCVCSMLSSCSFKLFCGGVDRGAQGSACEPRRVWRGARPSKQPVSLHACPLSPRTTHVHRLQLELISLQDRGSHAHVGCAPVGGARELRRWRRAWLAPPSRRCRHGAAGADVALGEADCLEGDIFVHGICAQECGERKSEALAGGEQRAGVGGDPPPWGGRHTSSACLPACAPRRTCINNTYTHTLSAPEMASRHSPTSFCTSFSLRWMGMSRDSSPALL